MVYIVQDKSAPRWSRNQVGHAGHGRWHEYPLDAGVVNEAAAGGLQINLDDMIDDGNVETQDPGIIDIGPIDLDGAGKNGTGVDNSEL